MSDPPKSPSGRRLLRDLALLLLALLAFQWWQGRDAPSGPAPPLSGRLLDGRQVSLADYRGAPLLVHFWATWCPVCRLEEGGIEAVSERWPVVTVATGSGEAEEVRAYLRGQGVSLPVLVDPGGEIARRWGVQGVPASFVLDGGGRVRSATRGYSTAWGLRLRLWWYGRH